MFSRILTTVIVAGGLAGLMRGSGPERGPLRLTLKRSVELALSPEGSAKIQMATELVRQAKARSAEARSALLPNLQGSVGEEETMRSLSELGLQALHLPFNLKIPSTVGPYTVMDVRATATQSIFNFSSIRRFQAARASVGAARSEEKFTEDQVVAQVAHAYLAALRARAELDTVKANVALAEALLKQAQNQKSAGTGTAIEVTRARVQLSAENQRHLIVANEFRRTNLQLLRAIGLNLDTEVELLDTLTYIPVDSLTLEKAKETALESRSDFLSQIAREKAARLSDSAAKAERLPSVLSFADYGTVGEGLNTSLLPTRTYGFAVQIPVFDGGRQDAHRAAAESQAREQAVRTSDMREQIELEIRLALDSLQSAEDQIKVAEEGLGLAEGELTQARRRYEAGVSGSLEVTDAQTRLERARDNRVLALYNYNVARFDLGQATGTIRSMIQ
jgi:outer membrane protein TolC